MERNIPKIIGLMKMRNEAHILKDTLDNWKDICTGGIYIYDDVSTDKSVEVARAHLSVKEVIEGEFWDPDREKAEWMTRQTVLSRAQQFADSIRAWGACPPCAQSPAVTERYLG